MTHIPHITLQEYFDRLLHSEDVAEVERHLGVCEKCASLLQFLKETEGAVRRIPLERPSPDFTQRVMRRIGLVGAKSLLRHLAFSLLPLVGVFLLVAILVGVVSAPSAEQSPLTTEASRQAETMGTTIGNAISTGTGVLSSWVADLVAYSATMPTLKFIIGILLVFAGIALFDEFVFVPLMRKRG
jgi:anti-sigma factor RsiW